VLCFAAVAEGLFELFLKKETEICWVHFKIFPFQCSGGVLVDRIENYQ